MTPPSTLEEALAHHRRGNLVDAARLYEAALAADARNAKALHMLGAVRLQEGRVDEAIGLIDAALVLEPDSADARCDIGHALHAAGRLDEATLHFDRALALRPSDADTLLARAQIAVARGRHDDALADLARASELRPDLAEAWRGRGAILLALDRVDDAIAAFLRALDVNPDFAEALNDLGNAYARQGRHEEAIACYDGAITIEPESAGPHSNRGNALVASGRHIEALVSYDRAIALQPDHPAFRLNRAGVRFRLQMHDLALDDFDAALALRGDMSEAHLGRAHVLASMRRHEEAARSYEAAVSIDPDLPFGAGYVAHARSQVCDWSDIESLTRRILDGIRARRFACVPFSLLAIADAPAEQLRCAADYSRHRYSARPFARPGARTSAQPGLRIAYLSANFHEHAVAYLIAELFERHDRSRHELTGISFGPDGSGAMRGRLQGSLHRFVDVRLDSDEEVARMMLNWEIDIAVDLMGHTADARPGILAYRPAPVQVNYLGYPGTMGAEFIDYIVADPFLVPAGSEGFYSEQVVRLPECYQPNDTRRRIGERTPTREELGLPQRGFVFCSFNNTFKINPPVFDVWMRLLRQVEGSVLWLLETSGAGKANLRREAEARGVKAERLVFAPRAELAEHLARHRVADLFLDTLPYNAHTTASDALWAGLPVLTCAGRSFAARVAGSLLHAVGLPELVTGSLAEYEALALALVRQPEQLAALRERLARNRLTAPLFDIERYTRHLEAAYETMWARHVQGELPRAFDVPPAPLNGAPSAVSSIPGR